MKSKFVYACLIKKFAVFFSYTVYITCVRSKFIITVVHFASYFVY